MDRQQLLALIDKTRRQNANVLDLSNKGITELPSEIGKLGLLTTLLVGRNRLRSLPPQIGHLANLIYLDIHHNDLVQLPREIGALTKLCHLDLRHNTLTGLPPEIGDLCCLSILDLSNNRIARLPASIAQLTDLFYLDVSENPLAAEIHERSPDAKAILSYLDPLGLLVRRHAWSEPWVFQEITDEDIDSLFTDDPPADRTDASEHGNVERAPRLPPFRMLHSEVPLREHLNRSRKDFTDKDGNLLHARLVGRRLTAVPPQIARLTALRTLDLSLNQLTTLPRELVL